MKSRLELMSNYNQWMNNKIYKAAAELGKEKIKKNMGAFFGSVLGTLNHILVADIIWLRRFSGHSTDYRALEYLRELPAPNALNQILFEDFSELHRIRQNLDRAIMDWCSEIKEEDLSRSLDSADMKGVKFSKNFGNLVLHFFNHQTHHRGQITTLLSQNGIDPGVTDFMRLIPEESSPN